MGPTDGAGYSPPMQINFRTVWRVFPWYTWAALVVFGGPVIWAFVEGVTMLADAAVAMVQP